jgi:peptide/nickel transport system substrate-binding protein/oligopeptide transport system substrate-binding protein
MQKRLMLSVAMLVIGASLLAATATAGSSASSGPEAASGPAQKGGTFRYSLDTDIDYVDTTLSYYAPTWQIMYASHAMLMNYPDAAAPRGSRLVPEVSAGMPRIAKNGKTYTFTLKKTYRFSNGQRVTAAHYAAAINRALNPKMASPAQPFIEDIVGAKAVIDGRATRATGVRTMGAYRLQIRLTKRAPDLLSRLAMPFFAPIPTNTPVNPDGIQAPVVGSGPYYIAAWTPKRSITLLRNRFYKGPRPNNINRFDYDIGLPLATIRLNVEADKTDHGPVPPAAHAELGQKYGVRKGSPGQYFVNPSAAFRYLAMNHDRPLFGGSAAGNVGLKKAVNFAIDRIAMINQRGAYAGVINDQYMPPTMRGFKNAAIYPSRPNVSRARSLAQGNLRGGKNVFYTCNTGPCLPTAQIVQDNLKAIGIDSEIKPFPRAVQFTKTGTRGEPFDMSLEGWHMDYFDPYDFIFLLDGTTIRPANNVNFSYFNSAAYNRKIAAAASLVGQARYRAFGNLDIDLARNAAPLASYITDNTRLLFSKSIGCFFYQPVYEVDLAALCKK